MGLERFTRAGGEPGHVDGRSESVSSTTAPDVPEPVRRAFSQPSPRASQTCELCSKPLAEDHRHVVDVEQRSLQCVCRACALLFTEDGAGSKKAVPETYRNLDAFELSRRQWSALQIPVDLAFLLVNSHLDTVVAFYPSPAGATESELSLQAWQDIVASNPTLTDLRPDVEAVLVRVEDAGVTEAYVVPIDRCYELVGHLRLNWRGFGGGQEVRERIDEFFAGVSRHAREPTQEAS